MLQHPSPPVNSDRILNNDNYDYDLADQFLTDLGEVVARALWED